jgi:hypothetical protein
MQVERRNLREPARSSPQCSPQLVTAFLAGPFCVAPTARRHHSAASERLERLALPQHAPAWQRERMATSDRDDVWWELEHATQRVREVFDRVQETEEAQVHVALFARTVCRHGVECCPTHGRDTTTYGSFFRRELGTKVPIRAWYDQTMFYLLRIVYALLLDDEIIIGQDCV